MTLVAHRHYISSISTVAIHHVVCSLTEFAAKCSYLELY